MPITEIRVRKKAVIQPEAYNSQELEVGIIAQVSSHEDYEQVKAALIAEVNETFITEAEPILNALDAYRREKWLKRLNAHEPEVTETAADEDFDPDVYYTEQGREHHHQLDEEEAEREAQEHFEAHDEGGVGGSYDSDPDLDTQPVYTDADSSGNGVPDWDDDEPFRPEQQ